MQDLRMLIAEQLLGFIISIVPKNNEDGKRLMSYIAGYLSETMEGRSKR